MKKLNKAINFAVKAHAGQTRKLKKEPYILHPLEAAAIIGRISDDEDLLCAAVLHDVTEDAGVSLATVKRKFGKRVAELLSHETENKRKGLSPESTWRVRKEESIAELKASDDKDVKLLWLADKLSNMRSVYAAYKTLGDGVWQAFHQQDKKAHEWYYRSVAEDIRPYFGDTIPFKEYENLLNLIFNKGE